MMLCLVDIYDFFGGSENGFHNSIPVYLNGKRARRSGPFQYLAYRPLD